MLEESIMLSPQKRVDSVLKVRQYKKSKRDPDPPAVKNSMRDLYWEGGDEDFLSATQSEFIGTIDDLFKEDQILVEADRLDCAQAQQSRQKRNLPNSNGFQSCDIFHATQNNSPTFAPSPQTQLTPDLMKNPTSEKHFEVTDSELLYFCEQVEKEDAKSYHSYPIASTSTTVHTPQQPAKSKAIIEMILNDFCSSPISPEGTASTSPQAPEDATPIFKFKTKTLRTYSRRRVSFSQENMEEHLRAGRNIELLSPEKKKISLHSNIKTDILITPTRLVTETSPEVFLTAKEDEGDSREPSELCATQSQLIGEILTLREKYPLSFSGHTSRSSSQELCGFSSDSSTDSCKDNTENIGTNNSNIYFNCADGVVRTSFNNSKEEVFGEMEDDWNMDCDFFANFKTQDVAKKLVTQDNCSIKDNSKVSSDISVQKLPPLPRESPTGCPLFQTAGKKPITVSETAKMRAQVILENLPPLKCGNGNDEPSTIKADKPPANGPATRFISQSGFKSLDELRLQEKRDLKQYKECGIKTIKQSSNNKMSGPIFQTASRKSISISEDSRKRAQAILEDLPPLKHMEDGKSCVSKAGIRSCSKTSSSDLKISEAELGAEQIFKDWSDDDDLKLCDIQIPNERSQLHLFGKNKQKYPSFQTASFKPIDVSDESRKRAQMILEDLPKLNYSDDDKPSTSKAGTKRISKPATREEIAAKETFKINSDCNLLNGEFSVAGSVLNRYQNCDVNNKIPKEVPKSAAININMKECPSFRTASLKTISISEASKKHALAILESLPEINYLEDQKAPFSNTKEDRHRKIHTNLYENQLQSKLKPEQINCPPEMDFDNIQLSEWVMEGQPKFDLAAEEEKKPIEEVKLDPKVAYTKNVNGDLSNSAAALQGLRHGVMRGLQTASKKPIQISEEARRTASNILSDLPEIPHKNVKIKENSQDSKVKSTKAVTPYLQSDEFQDIQLSAWPIVEEDVTSEPKTGVKRKYQTDDTVTNDTIIPPAKVICKSNATGHKTSTGTTHNHVDGKDVFKSSLTDLGVRSPLNASLTHSIISRKNLLSLSKRRRNRPPATPNSAISCIPSETPIKQASSSNPAAATTPGTPNIREFCDMLPRTSTPFLPKRKPVNSVLESAMKLDDMDADFKQIEWENGNDSMSRQTSNLKQLSTSKLSESCCANVILTQGNPTPKHRIERLHMYDNPPAVSPILMPVNNNCRTLGLRRRGGTRLTK